MSAADTVPNRAREARINAQICAAMREHRLNMGVLQAQLATHLGLAESTFSRYESGQRTLSAAMLCMIADYLHQPITAFLPPDMNLPAPIANTAAPSAPIQQIVDLLGQRPDLLPAVLGLLETLLEEALSTVDEQDTSVTHG
jgi:transcriptional regulator with XRE-family HTH domain